MPPEVRVASTTLPMATSSPNSENSGTAKKSSNEADAGKKSDTAASDKCDAPLPMSPRLRGPSANTSPLLPPAPGMPAPCLSPTLRGIAAGGISLVAGRRSIYTPQYRMLPGSNSETPPQKMAGKHYVAAPNLSLVEALDVVEYDMDRDDERWLSTENAAATANSHKPLSEDVFEIIINCLEKQTVLLKQHDQTAAEQMPITAQLARSVLIPMLKRLCGGTDALAASVLDQWLAKVFAHWQQRRQAIAPRTLLRWERPSTNLQPRQMVEHREHREHNRASLAHSLTEAPRRSSVAQRRERTQPNWGPQQRLIDGLDKLVPRCDILLLTNGTKSLMSNQANPPPLNRRQFMPTASMQEPEAVAQPTIPQPLNPETVQGLSRRFESERRARREAEVKLKRLRQHTGDELQNLRRKMESKVEEQEQMLAAIELNLDRLQEEEAALRRRCDAEHKKYEVEHRKYESERRTRQQREMDIERERKKQSRERSALEKRLQDEMVRSSVVQEDARTALERGLLGDCVAQAVSGIASHAERSLSSGSAHLDKLTASRKPARALSTLVAEVQGEFEHWHKTRVLQYEQASAQVVTEQPTEQQPDAPAEQPASEQPIAQQLPEAQAVVSEPPFQAKSESEPTSLSIAAQAATN